MYARLNLSNPSAFRNFYTAFSELLDSGRPLTVTKRNDGDVVINRMGWWDWANSWTFNRSLQWSHQEEITKIFTKIMNGYQFGEKRVPGLWENTPHTNSNSSLLRAAWKWNEKILKPLKKDPNTTEGRVIQTFQKSLTAARYGVSYAVLSKNEGFQKFAEKNHLVNYLSEFKDRLEVDQEGVIHMRLKTCSGEGHICSRGTCSEMVPWTCLREIVQDYVDERNILVSHHYGQMGFEPGRWPYSLGIPYEPTKRIENPEFKPYKRLERLDYFREREVLSIDIFSEGRPQITGSHFFWGYYMPNGDVYSAGIYRDRAFSVWQGMKNYPGFRQSPDVSLFFPNLEEDLHRYRFTAYRVGADKPPRPFSEICAQVSEEANEPLAYRVNDRLCNRDYIRLFDLNLDARMSIFEVMKEGPIYRKVQAVAAAIPDPIRNAGSGLGHWISKGVKKITNWVPSWISTPVKKVQEVASTTLQNTIAIIAGGLRTDQRIKDHPEATPLFHWPKSWRDFTSQVSNFFTKPPHFQHPWKLKEKMNTLKSEYIRALRMYEKAIGPNCKCANPQEDVLKTDNWLKRELSLARDEPDRIVMPRDVLDNVDFYADRDNDEALLNLVKHFVAWELSLEERVTQEEAQKACPA